MSGPGLPDGPTVAAGGDGEGRDALERRLRLAAAEQAALVEALAEARDDLATSRRALAGALADVADRDGERDALAAELAALRATATFRYSQHLRHLYARLRARGRR